MYWGSPENVAYFQWLWKNANMIKMTQIMIGVGSPCHNSTFQESKITYSHKSNCRNFCDWHYK